MLTAQLRDTDWPDVMEIPQGGSGSRHILLLMSEDSCPGGPSRGSGPGVWEGALTHKCDSVDVSGTVSLVGWDTRTYCHFPSSGSSSSHNRISTSVATSAYSTPSPVPAWPLSVVRHLDHGR